MTGPEMPCAELVERVTDYFEGAMTPEDLARFEAHLAECDACTLYVEQLRATVRLAGQLREDDVSPAMERELAAMFIRVRGGDGGGGAGPA